MCETDCAPSTSASAPWRCAIAIISAAGVTVPSALETEVNATMRVRGPSSFSYSSSLTSPLSSTGATRSLAPVAAQSCCQGTMLAWCSSQVTTISSPSRTLRRPQLCATRLIPSVAPRTNTISLARRRVEEPANLFARRLVGVGRAGGERVRGAMDVGILVRIVERQAVDHRLRLLRRRAVVEPDQPAAVDLLAAGSGNRCGSRRRRRRAAPAPASASFGEIACGAGASAAGAAGVATAISKVGGGGADRGARRGGRRIRASDAEWPGKPARSVASAARRSISAANGDTDASSTGALIVDVGSTRGRVTSVCPAAGGPTCPASVVAGAAEPAEAPPNERAGAEAGSRAGRRRSMTPNGGWTGTTCPIALAGGGDGGDHGAGADVGIAGSPIGAPPVTPLKMALASRSIVATSGRNAPIASGSAAPAAVRLRRRHACIPDSGRSRRRRAPPARLRSARPASNRAKSGRRRSPCG